MHTTPPTLQGEKKQSDWNEFYPVVTEEIPLDKPTLNVRGVSITTNAAIDHTSFFYTRRSVTGVLILVNNMPICWYCKKQNTLETSAYSFELEATRIDTEMR